VSATYARPARPFFKPRELDTGDGTVWYVEAEWEDGTIDEIGRFASASEAWDWIARHSREWFEERIRSGR
jgi:hypothetical protein